MFEPWFLSSSLSGVNCERRRPFQVMETFRKVEVTFPVSPQSDAWRTTRSSWRFRPPGPWKATPDSFSAKTTPSTSSSGNRWYEAATVKTLNLQMSLREDLLLHKWAPGAEKEDLLNVSEQQKLTTLTSCWIVILSDWQVACWCRRSDFQPRVFHYIRLVCHLCLKQTKVTLCSKKLVLMELPLVLCFLWAHAASRRPNRGPDWRRIRLNSKKLPYNT